MTFSEASAVTRIGSGSYRGEAQPDWDIFGVTNGGYVLAMAARAMTAEANGRHLASVNSRFINPTRPGPVTIEVETIKEGSALSTLTARVRDDERPRLIAHAAFTDGEHGREEDLLIDGGPPERPPVEECVRLAPSEDGPLPPPFAGKVGLYLHPEDLAYFG